MFNKEKELNNQEMEPIITKRPATDADTEFAKNVHHTAYHDVIVRQFGSFDEKMQDDFFFKTWKPETHEIIISDGVDAGYFSIESFSDHIFAHELVLLPEFQGKGIGSKLLKEVLRKAKTNNIPVQLQVLKENSAQDLYRRLGFKETGSNATHIQMEFNPDENRQ